MNDTANLGQEIGVVTHYYDHLQVAIVKLSDNIKISDTLRFKGSTTDFEQIVTEMQFDHQPIEVGKQDMEVGIKITEVARKNDKVYKVN